MPYFKPRILLRCLVGMHDVYPGQPAFFSNEPDKLRPLYLAAFCGFNGLAKHLIITHAQDVNAKCGGFYPLHEVSIYGQIDTARILLENGAHVNVEGSGRFTPLHYASKFGHPKLTRLFLEHGANLNARTKWNDTPLYLASREGHLEIVRLLLNHGADVTIRGDEDLTPYQVATQLGHHDVAQLLSEHGAEGE